jgi:CheY-like chemotaxis protein
MLVCDSLKKARSMDLISEKTSHTLGLQDLFRTFLKQIGFSRVVVGTASEAIKSLRKQKFDLMFLDLQLLEAPGDQVYKTAKQIDPDLNVIVITGYPDSEILDRILQGLGYKGCYSGLAKFLSPWRQPKAETRRAISDAT